MAQPNLAAVLVEPEPETALELIDPVLSTEQVAALPDAHPLLAVYWNTKAFALSALGKPDAARGWAIKALEIVLEVYRPDHPVSTRNQLRWQRGRCVGADIFGGTVADGYEVLCGSTTGRPPSRPGCVA
jgi:hypothetical protein